MVIVGKNLLHCAMEVLVLGNERGHQINQMRLEESDKQPSVAQQSGPVSTAPWLAASTSRIAG